MFKDNLIADLGESFFNTDYFAQEALLNSVPVVGIFDESYEIVDADGIVSQLPAFIVPKQELYVDDVIEIDGAVWYVGEIVPEGDISVALLRR